MTVRKASVSRWALLWLILAVGLAACSSQSEDEALPPTPESATAAEGSEQQGPATQPKPPPSDLDARLLEAAWANDLEAATRLIDAGADVNAKDGTEQSAYLVATSEGHLELLEITLEQGGDVAALDNFRGTGLIRAAERGHAGVVGRLLQTAVAVDHVNRLGWTALHEAIILGDGDQRYVDTVRLLVAGGADLELAPAQDGIAPTEHARRRDQAQIVETLGRGMADAPLDANTALLDAASSGDADGVAHALRSGAALEARDSNSRTPLLLAALNDHPDVARLLVALGADTNAIDDRNDTPWLVTGVTGSVAMLEALLPGKPDLTIVNRFGGTSLIPASERGHVDYVQRVLETGIDVNHVNNLGWTALLEAVILGDGTTPYQEIVRILLDAGASPAIADSDGVSPLQHAETKGHTAIARILEGS